jgi:hypothetical protein
LPAVSFVYTPRQPTAGVLHEVVRRHLRYRLAYDHGLCREVVRIWSRVLRAHYRRQARAADMGASGGETGMVTGLQRFGGAVNLHVHAHTLVLDGVFAPAADGTLVRRRVAAGLARRGIDLEGDDADPLAEESLARAGLGQAAVQGRAALGRRAGRGPVRLGADPHAPWVERAGPWRAHDAGFDVHAGVTVAAYDRVGRPPRPQRPQPPADDRERVQRHVRRDAAGARRPACSSGPSSSATRTAAALEASRH